MHRALVDEPAMFAINDRGLAERRFFHNDLKQSEGDQPDGAATRWALERNLLTHPGHQFRPGNPRGVVRAGLLVNIAGAVRCVPAGRVLAALANVPFSPAT